MILPLYGLWQVVNATKTTIAKVPIAFLVCIHSGVWWLPQLLQELKDAEMTVPKLKKTSAVVC